MGIITDYTVILIGHSVLIPLIGVQMTLSTCQQGNSLALL